MKKNIFRMMAATVVAACMAACSGSDDVTSNAMPQEPSAKGDGAVVLTGTLGSGDKMTRSAIYTETGVTTWFVGDQFAIWYPTASGGHSTAVATVESLNDNGSANFTATLYYPITGDVNLVHPVDLHDGNGGLDKSILMTQKGTGKAFYKATTSLTVNDADKKARLDTDEVTMQPEICQFDMKMTTADGKPLLVSKLEISDGTNNYTITPDEALGNFHVGLLPVENADITFTATAKVYEDLHMKLSDCTSDNVGDFFDAEGNLYRGTNADGGAIYTTTITGKTLVKGTSYQNANVKLTATSAESITPVAMIAYVGEPGTADTSEGSEDYRGLAMSLHHDFLAWVIEGHGDNESEAACVPLSNVNDVQTQRKGIENTNILANHTCNSNHIHPAAEASANYSIPGFTPSEIGCSSWFLPAAHQWKLFIDACGGTLGTNVDLSKIFDKWNYIYQAHYKEDAKFSALFSSSSQNSKKGVVRLSISLGKLQFNYSADDLKGVRRHSVQHFLAFK